MVYHTRRLTSLIFQVNQTLHMHNYHELWSCGSKNHLTPSAIKSSFIKQPILHQLNSLFQSDSTECGLFQFPVSFRFLNVIKQLLMSSSSLFCDFYSSSYLSLTNVFQKAVPTQDVTNQVSIPSSLCKQDTPFLPDSM